MSYKRISQVAISITLFLITISVFPQVNKVPNLKLYDYDQLHFGFILAANQMDFSIKLKDDFHFMEFTGDAIPPMNIVPGKDSNTYATLSGVQALPGLGFTVGMVGDKRIGEYFNFRFTPSLAFGKRTLRYYINAFNVLIQNSDTSYIENRVGYLDQPINSTFVEFPFLLKYKSKRNHNMRAYVFTGVKFSIDLAAEANKDQEAKLNPRLYLTDNSFLLGTGVDIYMNWFKFGIELSMSYGMRDMLLRENNLYTDGIESLKSKIFMFTFTFE